MTINFSSHLKYIDRQSEPQLKENIIKMHKRERNYPFNNEIENSKYSINQVKLNYPYLNNLYAEIAKYYSVRSNEIIITAGCDIALRTIYESLSDLDFLFLPNSCYAMNFIYKKIYHPKASQIDYEFNDKGLINSKKLLESISSKGGLKMLVLESPSGFTGQDINKEEFEEILKFCEKNNIILVVDETYLETRFFKWTAKEYIEYENLIILRSFSKAYGLAGLRAGLIISNHKNISVLRSLLPMHEVTTFTSDLLLKILKDKSLNSFRSQILDDENLLFNRLNKTKGFEILKTQTNFILFKNAKFSNQYLHDYLLSKNIKIKVHKPVRYFGGWCSASMGNKLNNKLLMNALNELE
jgi:histidinol-phosphate/aromatic aminotransferase/cobyric acid decarboxylase-like protein